MSFAGRPIRLTNGRQSVAARGIPGLPPSCELLSTSTRNYGHDRLSAHMAGCARSALSPEGTNTSPYLCIEGLSRGSQVRVLPGAPLKTNRLRHLRTGRQPMPALRVPGGIVGGMRRERRPVVSLVVGFEGKGRACA